MLEGRIDLALDGGCGDIAQAGGDSAERCVRPDFGTLGGREVDAGVDGERGGVLLVDVVDPGRGGVYPGLASGSGVNIGHEGIDHIQVEDAGGWVLVGGWEGEQEERRGDVRIVFTEGESRVVGDGAEVVEVAGCLSRCKGGEAGCEEGVQEHDCRVFLCRVGLKVLKGLY